MSDDLDDGSKAKQPMGPEEDQYDEYAEWLPKVEPVPQHVGERTFQLPLEERADRKIYGVPKAYVQICPFPDPGNTIDPLHVIDYCLQKTKTPP